MSLVSFLKLVEIQTKAASVIPFALGTLITRRQRRSMAIITRAIMP